jgi:hypothetical protein
MTTRTRILSLVCFVVVASLGAMMAQAQKKPGIAYPGDFRHWRHVKSMVIFSSQNKLFDKFGGLHNIYINDTGWPALQKNKLYPDGSMFALELFDVSNSMGAIEPRPGHKAVYVMKKSAKLYADTGGWGFEVFQGESATGSLKDMKACFDCHKEAKSKDYVESGYVE